MPFASTVTSGVRRKHPVLVSQPSGCVLPFARVTGQSMKKYDLPSRASEIEAGQSNITALSSQP
jgi:hypothetical protein